jgi:hypothetical protein
MRNPHPETLGAGDRFGDYLHTTSLSETPGSLKTNRMISRKAKVAVSVTNPNQKPFILTLAGRNLWAMEQLILAGEIGCTPIDNPAPRWSAYVFNLRQFGVDIETLHEKHGGEYSGKHARYVLRANVKVSP